MALSGHERLREIRTFSQLVKYLRDELGWPIETDDFEDLTYEYEPQELGLDSQTAVKVRKIHQLRPLTSSQPWGIFFLDFEPKRLPVVVLRKILSALVIKKRQSAARAQRASWQLHDLLFISSYGEGDHRDLTFAHFSEDLDSGDLPALRVLGWDDEDTVRHLEHADHVLAEKLRWPSDEADTAAWRQAWSEAFTLKHREVITTSQALAKCLAELAKAIRKRVNAVLRVESDKGAMRKLMASFKEALIHDLTDDDFADMYAQTITYGLLAARVSRPAGLVAENVTEMVPETTNPFLRDLLATFVKVGGRRGKLDFDELGVNDVVETLRAVKMEAVLRDFDDRNPQEDPVIHFYELFLKEYDRKKRIKRGVFFTPRPVVSFIVRSVDEILRTEFGLEDGLADTTTWGEMIRRHPDLKLPEGTKSNDPFVCILDPACGTGTFLVEVIDLIHKTMVAKWKREGASDQTVERKWNEYVPDHLLPRLHGFELMMAPYAIADMKVGLKLAETGYRFGASERARIYLTNTLDPPHEFAQRMLLDAPALAHEAQAVNTVKRAAPFTVVVGNPPYSKLSSNMLPEHRAIVDAYRYIDGQRVRERGALSLEINLQDDYVKFFRWSEREIARANQGILGLITNHGYLSTPTLRGMRWNLLRTLSSIRVVDLRGSAGRSKCSRHGGVDENVFDIQQGVGLFLGVKVGTTGDGLASVRHSERQGTRADKLSWLQRSSAAGTSWTDVLPLPPRYLYIPIDYSRSKEYETGVSLAQAFALGSDGILTGRDALAVGFAQDELLSRIERFRDSTGNVQDICGELGISAVTPRFDPDRCRRALRRVLDLRPFVIPLQYRPFDYRWLFYSRDLVEMMRSHIVLQFGIPGNVAIAVTRQVSRPHYEHALVSRSMVEKKTVSHDRNTRVFPLFVAGNSGGSSLLPSTTSANWTPEFASLWRERIGMDIREPENARLAFHAIYAILYSHTYRERYLPFLRSDFPRVPTATDTSFVTELAVLGADLTALHTLDADYFWASWRTRGGGKRTPFSCHSYHVEGRNREIVAGFPRYANGRVWVNSSLFVDGVSESVWEFHIGGYRVCEKWLKDRRGRVLSDDDIAHYQKIIVAINETIRIMAEIDKVIEEHGGWPNAFVTGNASP